MESSLLKLKERVLAGRDAVAIRITPRHKTLEARAAPP